MSKPSPDKCSSCGKRWINHDGMIRTCADLQAAKAKIAQLEDTMKTADALIRSLGDRCEAQLKLLAKVKRAEKPKPKKK